MPHLFLEYSNNIKEKIDFDALFGDLHQILVLVASASLDSCKSRAIGQDIFRIGDGSPKNAFVHLSVLIAEGRSPHIKEELGKQFLKVFEEFFEQSFKSHNLQITIEIREFAKQFYFRSL